MRPIGLIVLLLSAGLVLPAHAEVKASDQFGFVSTHDIELAATPVQSYRAFVEDVAQWWDAEHSFGGQASAFSIEDVAGGCFCEVIDDVAVQHMEVVNVAHGRSIVMRGGLGPLQSMAVTGSMSFEFKPHAGGTMLHYKYSVGGYLPGGLQPLAGPVDQVQLGQLKRLQAYLAQRN